MTKKDKEFGGTFGAAATTFALPLVCVWFHIVARHWNWELVSTLPRLIDVETMKPLLHEFIPNQYSVAVVFGWTFSWVFLYYAVPGKIKKGLPDQDTGEVLEYPINGLFAYLLQAALVVAGYVHGVYDPAVFVENYSRIMVVAIISSFVISVYLYVSGKDAPHSHATGSFFYDFFIGVQRNPRIGSFDLKFFFEGRPGLSAWSLIGWVFAFYQLDTHGSISHAMLVTNILHTLYIFDYYVVEEYILTTFDIVNDEFGFMLCFGDFGWVPFVYTLQEWYLVDHSPDWPWYVFVGLLGLGIFSYVSFRLSNKERNDFKSGVLKGADSMKMTRFDGSTNKYLVSGYSAYCRRPNYWPDILNGLSYSLPTGFNALLPYFYPIYFSILLIHRDHRLETKGRRTYKNWQEFCDRVPYRLIPYVY